MRGGWSPTGRALLGAMGSGLFLSGLTRKAPTACILGTAGLALMLEAATNAGIEEIAQAPSKAAKMVAENFGRDGQKPRRQERMTVY